MGKCDETRARQSKSRRWAGLSRGFENERELGSTSDGSDEGAESDRKLESLGAMDFEWARELLCVCCGWVTVFVSLA